MYNKNIDMNKLKQKYLYTGFFITILFLSFCIWGEKVFAVDDSTTTNPKCVLKYGNADANISIVFMSDYDKNITIANDALEMTYNYIFKSVTPYKQNIGKIALYLDKQRAEDTIDFMDSDPATNGKLENKNNSSCKGKTYYIIIAERSGDLIGLQNSNADRLSGIVVIYSKPVPGKISSNFPFTYVINHELGHVIGELLDEYKVGNGVKELPRDAGGYRGESMTNCVPENIVDNYWNNYENIAKIAQCDLFNEKNFVGIRYRDKDSAMGENTNYTTRFNPISCAWISLGLNTPGGLVLSKIKEVVSSQSKFDKILGPYLEKCGAPRKVSTKTIVFPPEKICEETTFTNISDKSPYDTDMKISSSDDISLLTIDGDNFFKINGKDLSKPDGNGGRKIPAGDLVVIPANTEIKIETGDIYCRDYDITLSLQEESVDLQSPFECFSDC
jgi:hypothetical protein